MHQKSQPRRDAGDGRPCANLSYKFQRLREQIRRAILKGEFESRLPGERELGRRYNANPKTVNKALCDLSSEGLVIRQIGRGTYITGRNGQAVEPPKQRTIRCLLPLDSSDGSHRRELINAVREIVVARGHTWENLTIETVDDLQQIPLAGWTSSTRHATDALLCYPNEPLCRRLGYLNDALVAETFRRHVSVVVLAACAGSAKLNAVVPDYVDAGFRMSEHLFRVGCNRIVVLCGGVQGRETAMVVSGCNTAATRYCGHVTEIALRPDEDQHALRDIEALLGQGRRSREDPGNPTRRSLGIICVGTPALEAATAGERPAEMQIAGRLSLACVAEPGDLSAEAAGITAYEVDCRQIASWAARLLLESRPGQSPVEIVVPGELRIRSAHPNAVTEGCSCRPAGVAGTVSSPFGPASEAII